MFIPRHWHRHEEQAVTPRGERFHFSIWRGSLHSIGEAQSLAREAARRMADRIRRGEGFPLGYYGDRPLRERIIAEFGPRADGTADIVVTRNAYGALVLNTADVCFIDVDPPSRAQRSFLGGLLDVLRGRTAPPPPDVAEEALPRLRGWLSVRADWGVRVYRTRSGLRYLITHGRLEPGGPDAEAAMNELGADPQYVRLCRVQKSFRARLTPKPWRCGMRAPPVRFPTDAPGAAERMAAWETKYARTIAPLATCALVETHGPAPADPAILQVVALHDEHTRATSGLPLA